MNERPPVDPIVERQSGTNDPQSSSLTSLTIDSDRAVVGGGSNDTAIRYERPPVDPLREAAQRVVETWQTDPNGTWVSNDLYAAIAGLRAALASPAALDPMTVTHVCPACGRPTHTVDGPVASPAAPRPRADGCTCPPVDGNEPHLAGCPAAPRPECPECGRSVTHVRGCSLARLSDTGDSAVTVHDDGTTTVDVIDPRDSGRNDR